MLSLHDYVLFSFMLSAVLGAICSIVFPFSWLVDEVLRDWQNGKHTFFYYIPFVYLVLWLIVYPIGCVAFWFLSS